MKGSPHLGPTKTQQPTASQASPIQRAMMNRQQAARSISTSVMPALQPVHNMMQGGHESPFPHSSPYPRNPSKNSSPSCSRPPGFTMQAGMSSPNSNFPAQQMHQQRPQVRPQRKSFSQHPAVPRHGSGPLTTPPGPIPGKINPSTIISLVSASWRFSYEGPRPCSKAGRCCRLDELCLLC
jgi:hypothetical protein